MATAPYRITGTVNSPDQYNFYLENQAALCTPTDTGGLDVKVTSKYPMSVQQTLSRVLGCKESSITVETPRLGGGFGGKGTYPSLMAGMCAVSAYVMKRPVLLNMDIHANIQFQGKRTFFVTDYEIGFDDSGKIVAIIATTYADSAALYNPGSVENQTQELIDNSKFFI